VASGAHRCRREEGRLPDPVSHHAEVAKALLVELGAWHEPRMIPDSIVSQNQATLTGYRMPGRDHFRDRAGHPHTLTTAAEDADHEADTLRVRDRRRVTVVTAEGPYFGRFLGDRTTAGDDAAAGPIHQSVDEGIAHGHGCIVAAVFAPGVGRIVTSGGWVRRRRIVSGSARTGSCFARAAFYHAALYSMRVILICLVPVRSVMGRALFYWDNSVARHRLVCHSRLERLRAEACCPTTGSLHAFWRK
jgi:hypothetical protein